MTKTARAAGAAPRKRTAKPASAGATTARRKRSKRSPTDVAITNDLAPAVALALLEKTEQADGAAPPALEVLAVAAAPSEIDGNVRVELLFESGTVLPVEMSVDAGSALVKGLKQELPDR